MSQTLADGTTRQHPYLFRFYGTCRRDGVLRQFTCRRQSNGPGSTRSAWDAAVQCLAGARLISVTLES